MAQPTVAKSAVVFGAPQRGELHHTVLRCVMPLDPEKEHVPLRDVVVAGKVTCPLEEAALHLARQEYPDLDVKHWTRPLDDFAERVRPLLSTEADAAETVGALNDVLFRDLGFRGNSEDYYDPRNSFLNDVIERRCGIPISLATVYMAVARRVGCRLQGTAFPGHFLVCFQRPGWPIVIDCFHGGHILSEEECRMRLQQGGHPAWEPRVLEPVPDRAILRRMLNNLKSIYLDGRDWERLRRTVLQILVVTPEDHDERFALAVGLAGVGRSAEALTEVERFLELRPDSPSRPWAERMLRELRARLA